VSSVGFLEYCVIASAGTSPRQFTNAVTFRVGQSESVAKFVAFSSPDLFPLNASAQGATPLCLIPSLKSPKTASEIKFLF